MNKYVISHTLTNTFSEDKKKQKTLLLFSDPFQSDINSLQVMKYK